MGGTTMEGMNRIIRWIPAVAMLATIIALSSRLEHLKKENARLENNVEALTNECDTFRTVNGRLVTECITVIAERDEMKNLFIDANKKVKELEVKLKYAQSVSTAAQHSEMHIVTEVHDTVYVENEKPERAKVFSYNDAWTSIRGEIRDSLAKIDYTTTDTISQVVYRVPKKWWFFRWGTKCVKVRMACSNPHNSIVYNEFIQIKK